MKQHSKDSYFAVSYLTLLLFQVSVCDGCCGVMASPFTLMWPIIVELSMDRPVDEQNFPGLLSQVDHKLTSKHCLQLVAQSINSIKLIINNYRLVHCIKFFCYWPTVEITGYVSTHAEQYNATSNGPSFPGLPTSSTFACKFFNDPV